MTRVALAAVLLVAIAGMSSAGLEQARSDQQPFYAPATSLNGDSATTPLVQSAQAETSDLELVRSIQKSLQALGYDPGPVDGIVGEKTRAAVKAFQSDIGGRVTGEISQGLELKLLVEQAGEGEAAPPPAGSTPVEPAQSAQTSPEFKSGLAAYENSDYATALEIWEPLAEQGDADAQYQLGIMYNLGLGVPKDAAKGMAYYYLAARAEHELAQYVLAMRLEVRQLHSEAVKWYRKLASKGWIVAQNALGDIYYNGRGVPENFTEAFSWYRMAAEQGDAHAQFRTGIMYDFGEGIPKDDAEATKWYRKAAEQGHVTAQYNLGIGARWA